MKWRPMELSRVCVCVCVCGGGGEALECEWVGFMTTHNPYLRILGFVKEAPPSSKQCI
jgi:hypothetical protein